jgi:hypothetical protein
MSGETKATIRPERVRLEPQGASAENRLPGMVERWVYLGNAVQVIARLATGQAIQVLIQNTGDDILYAPGTPVQVHLPADALARPHRHRRAGRTRQRRCRSPRPLIAAAPEVPTTSTTPGIGRLQRITLQGLQDEVGALGDRDLGKDRHLVAE